MKIEEKSLEELKAMAYDIVVNVQKLQNDLMIINQVIAKKSQSPQNNEDEINKKRK
jgi:hypothetical protein